MGGINNMNCPTCGAENEADARFCAECGSPLEGQADQSLAEDDDRTILSTVSEISEEAKTVAVTQEDVANLAAELETEETEAESDSSVPPSSPLTGGTGGGGEGLLNQRNIIIAIVVLLVLCCCCCAIAVIVGVATGQFENITSGADLIVPLLPFV
jgi:hypothetical protein